MAERIQHAEDCYSGDTCVECGGCDCGWVPSTCEGPGCYSVDARDQWRCEMGYDDEESSYA